MYWQSTSGQYVTFWMVIIYDMSPADLSEAQYFCDITVLLSTLFRVLVPDNRCFVCHWDYDFADFEVKTNAYLGLVGLFCSCLTNHDVTTSVFQLSLSPQLTTTRDQISAAAHCCVIDAIMTESMLQ